MTTSEPEHFQFASTDGLRIACVKWKPRSTVRGVVQIAHGLGEHIGRYGELAAVLTQEGFAVYGNDHRGHGLTAKSSANFGGFGPGGFDQLVEDMATLTARVRAEHPDVPLILLGHSMGSFACQQFILDHSRALDGLALSGSGALDGLAQAVQGVPIENAMGLMNAGFGPVRTPLDWLSRDAAEVDAAIRDRLCFPSLQPRSMESFVGAGARLADAHEIGKVRKDLPIYLFSGSDDPVGQRLDGVNLLIRRYRSAGIASIEHDFYPGGRHEMLHEINRGEVSARLTAWMARVQRTR